MSSSGSSQVAIPDSFPAEKETDAYPIAFVVSQRARAEVKVGPYT